jgi:hypothetical protein
MSDTTVTQFVTAARKAGLKVVVLGTDPDEPEGVNVWSDPEVRMPETTVWWPRPNQASDGFVWGPSFQYGAHRDIPAETLVEKVKETLPGEGE